MIGTRQETTLTRWYPIVLAAALSAFALPAAAKSDKSRVVQKALRQSVRVEVTVRGKVERMASGVVVAANGHTSWILTNQHVVQRDGLRGTATFQVVIERPKLRRVPARVVAEGSVPDEDLALVAIDEVLPVAPIAAEDQVDVGDDVVVIGAPYGRALS